MDVNENVRHCDVGLATGGALNLVSLIDHTCLGNVCIFIHYKSQIFMGKKRMRGQHTACTTFVFSICSINLP